MKLFDLGPHRSFRSAFLIFNTKWNDITAPSRRCVWYATFNLYILIFPRKALGWSEADPHQISWSDSSNSWEICAINITRNRQEEVPRTWFDALWWIQVHHPQASTIPTLRRIWYPFCRTDIVSIREEYPAKDRYVSESVISVMLLGALMSELYEAFKDPDGFLYMVYSAENTLGAGSFWSKVSDSFTVLIMGRSSWLLWDC